MADHLRYDWLAPRSIVHVHAATATLSWLDQTKTPPQSDCWLNDYDVCSIYWFTFPSSFGRRGRGLIVTRQQRERHKSLFSIFNHRIHTLNAFSGSKEKKLSIGISKIFNLISPPPPLSPKNSHSSNISHSFGFTRSLSLLIVNTLFTRD